MEIKMNNQKMLLLGVLLFVLLYALFYFGNLMIVDPYRADYQVSSQALQEQEAVLLRMQGEERTLNELEEEYEDLRVYLPVTPKTDQMLEELEELANTYDVTVNRISNLQGDSQIESTEFELMQSMYHVEVSYTDLENFHSMVDDFFELDRIIEITTLEYSQTDSDEQIGTFTVRTYFQGE